MSCGVTDMRKGFDGLAVLVQQVLHHSSQQTCHQLPLNYSPRDRCRLLTINQSEPDAQVTFRWGPAMGRDLVVV